MAGTIDSHRDRMVQQHLVRRGIRDQRVLEAMATVPREAFVGVDMAEFAYEDSPLPIEEGQTISQPYIVALMTEALELKPTDRALEIGTGSGYAAAVLSRVAKEVYTVERHASLAHLAARRVTDLGYDNVHILNGDGTLGWPEYAPYDAIVVAAGGPEVPRPLLEQLAIGGRLVIPTGQTPREQELIRVRRVSQREYRRERLGAVRFVPLVGREGFTPVEEETMPARGVVVLKPEALSERIAREAESFERIESVDLSAFLERVGDSKVVLLGEATHGTAEFYDMRARITRELIEKKGFTIVAVEADWPDAAQIDHFVRDTRIEPTEDPTFARFPTWMWANAQVLAFVQWLRKYNRNFQLPDDRVGFYGLDLYSLFASIDAVVRYLDRVDPQAAAVARKRYGCLSPWENEPAIYGAAAFGGRHEGCEEEVVSMLKDLMDRRMQYVSQDGRHFLDAVSNARIVKDAEQYYKIMYRASAASWNLRDKHMFETLESLLEYGGRGAKAVVWEHNSHVGDASATQMSVRGEYNVGQLTREKFGDKAYIVGFGTDHGTVAAASDWGGPVEFKQVRPAHPRSYERVFHDSGVPRFMLPLRDHESRLVRLLMEPRLERAIGVIYRPETELASHYFQACLPRQFDEYIWFDETNAVSPIGPESGTGMPDTFPFGL